MTILALFLFIIMLAMSGMAVDLMVMEKRRVDTQNVMDGAVIAATALSQERDAEAVAKDFIASAGFNPDDFVVTVNEVTTTSGRTAGRQVTIGTRAKQDTIFMGMMGIPTLTMPVLTQATESAGNTEISLVLDISSSMGSNSRIENLKVAAKQFVDAVMPDGGNGKTSISIVPYFGGVVVGPELLSRLNADGTTKQVTGNVPYVGALAKYATEHTDATCVRFAPDDYLTRSITPQQVLPRVAHFQYGSNDFETPTMDDRWCKENRAQILPLETNAGILKTYIDNIVLGVYTGGHIGMKWGVALLDPAMGTVVNGMVDDMILSEDVRGRPHLYTDGDTQKIIVMMTDGKMTRERDLKDEFKFGPSRVWFSQATADANTPYDGYFVLMPSNGVTEKFYVPGSPDDTGDDTYVAATDLPLDAVQLDYLELNRRFAEDDIASFFFEHSDSTAYNAHRDAAYDVASYGEIDTRLWNICDKAKENGDIIVYTIGFEAPAEGVEAMRRCATSEGHFFDVAGTDIYDAFQSIAAQINVLKLTR